MLNVDTCLIPRCSWLRGEALAGVVLRERDIEPAGLVRRQLMTNCCRARCAVLTVTVVAIVAAGSAQTSAYLGLTQLLKQRPKRQSFFPPC